MAGTLYRMVQFAIREAVATRTLDDILASRDTIDGEVREYVGKRAAELGVEIGEIGVKDVILPGDVREPGRAIRASSVPATLRLGSGDFFDRQQSHLS